MPSDSDWENVSLGQLRAWDWAPEVPAMLQKNGQPISLTLHGLKEKNHFRANLAKAIERGLAKRDALAALTAPAKLTGVSDQLGTIETGKLANLVMVEGIFRPQGQDQRRVDRGHLEFVRTPKTGLDRQKEGPGQKKE